jgi:hypothetical protein
MSQYIPLIGDMTDNAVVNVMTSGDQVYALTETPRACRIDPVTLETIENVNNTSCDNIIYCKQF